MNDDFLCNLKDYEKEIYFNHKHMKENRSTNRPNIISPLNDLIRFNPFQYEPYYKLTKQEEYPKAIYIADEVGSGKTIETGIILTELIYQNEINLLEDICLIICPNLLCRKWRDTLKSLFGIGSSVVYSIKDVGIGLNILSYDTVSNNCDEINEELKIKLLIMDEAHNASGDRYDKIWLIREKVNGYVVLLSATPLSGNDHDEKIQLKLLKENLDIENFFNSDSKYLCKNKKMSMRYAENPEKYKVNVKISNHYIKNDELLEFKERCKEIFSGKNTLLQFQGLNMIMSSPEAGILFMKRLLDKNDDELLKYLQTSNEKSDMDDESEDDEGYEDIVDEKYSLDDVNRIRKNFEKINIQLSEIMKREKEDKKFEELLKLIEKNKERFENKEDEEYSFYNHVIIFTDRLSTVEYLEKRLREKKYKTFRVTGGLFESEKRARLLQYENVRDEMSILIITNVACEGQDMDYGNTIVNYDMDYNPVRLEQRRGRIDRFEVKKQTIYIHNFMIDGYDYDPNETEKGYDNYSKVLRIWNKITEIKNSTSTYYEILKNDHNKPEGEEDELESNKREVCEHVIELVGAENIDLENLKSSDLYSYVRKSCVQQFGKQYGDVYELVSDRLKDLNLKIEKNDDDQIVIKTSKKNQDFLNSVYSGGTLISHLILGEK